MFQTPPRILIPKLVAGREGWKAKAGDRKKRLKAAGIRIRDLEASRQGWRERASAAAVEVRELRQQLRQAQQAVVEAKRLLDESPKKWTPPRGRRRRGAGSTP